MSALKFKEVRRGGPLTCDMGCSRSATYRASVIGWHAAWLCGACKNKWIALWRDALGLDEEKVAA